MVCSTLSQAERLAGPPGPVGRFLFVPRGAKRHLPGVRTTLLSFVRTFVDLFDVGVQRFLDEVAHLGLPAGFLEPCSLDLRQRLQLVLEDVESMANLRSFVRSNDIIRHGKMSFDVRSMMDFILDELFFK